MSLSSKEIKHWGNRYAFLEKIGTGAYGTAYKVKDVTGPEGQGSIKVLKEICVESMNKDEIDECTREGKLLSKLNNAHIVQYFDSFCFLGNYCIITEFCEGGDLNKVIVTTKESGSYLAEKRILRWFIELIRGLDYIHKRKILHRDLKPRNIFLKGDSAKIGDFGISRILNFTMDMASTFIGTPYYMSPEVLKHDGYNTTSDVWSIGVILYEMCSLKHAFEAQSIMSVMVKILDEPIPKIPSHYNEAIQNLIESVLVKDPDNRPSAQDILKFPFIKNTIKDPWIDIAESLDLSKTLLEKEAEDISNYMSQSTELKTLSPRNNETMKLTPKEKLAMKKKLKADQEAEEKTKFIREEYKQNQETRKILKQSSLVDSLPFSKARYERNRISISECNELASFYISGSQTTQLKTNEIKETWKPLSRTENIHSHFKIDPEINSLHNDGKTFRLSNNQQELFNITYSNLKFDDLAKCKITTYEAENSPISAEAEVIYESDFDDSVSNSEKEEEFDESSHQIVLDRFQDDDETDPFGKSTKIKKIHTMTKKCLEKIDETTLQNALTYLEKHYSENYLSGLRKICQSDDIALIVDQIFFLIKFKEIF